MGEKNPLDVPYPARGAWVGVEGMGVCSSVHLNINFKHLNRDTSRVPPRRAQLATLDRACHRSSRIKEEEETHQLFNKRVGLPSVTPPISPCWLPFASATQPKNSKCQLLTLINEEGYWKLYERKGTARLLFATSFLFLVLSKPGAF